MFQVPEAAINPSRARLSLPLLDGYCFDLDH